MGEIKGFLKYKRQEVGHKPVEERVKDFSDFDIPLTSGADSVAGGEVYGLRCAVLSRLGMPAA